MQQFWSGILKLRHLLLLLTLFGGTVSYAQDDAEANQEEAVQEEDAPAENTAEGDMATGDTATGQAIYLPIKPQFVVNYGDAGRLRYLKAEVSVRLATTDAAHAVREHLPYVRNNLVMLFASQTNETVSSQEGKEKMLADAREAIREIVNRENGIPKEHVVDVYFNSFFVQK